MQLSIVWQVRLFRSSITSELYQSSSETLEQSSESFCTFSSGSHYYAGNLSVGNGVTGCVMCHLTDGFDLVPSVWVALVENVATSLLVCTKEEQGLVSVYTWSVQGAEIHTGFCAKNGDSAFSDRSVWVAGNAEEKTESVTCRLHGVPHNTNQWWETGRARAMVLKTTRVTVIETAQQLKLKYSFNKMEMKTVTGCSVYIHYMPSYCCPYDEHTLNTELGNYIVSPCILIQWFLHTN